ncbi:ChaN family lipoprotein [Agrobacterium pusense]|uniref:ChaN family lipoprotein n=1 Tax=Agrobacterium pusense TaxID=648995 RepID=UPI00286B97B7|nr:ChaN family lipoprotein [Agrobacterium pusense]
MDAVTLKQSIESPAICSETRSEAIYNRTGHPVTVQEAMRHISSADYVLAGEIHTNPAHHDIQAHLVEELARRNRFRAVLFEMLEPRHDVVVASFTDGVTSIQQLESALQWGERGWRLWESYAPIFLSAKRGRLEVAHAGMDAELMRHVNQFGTLALPRRLREALGMAKDGEFVVNFEHLKAEVERSHSSTEAPAARLAVSQYVKDAYMAYRLASLGGPAILIAGNTHVRSDIGVPPHLRKYKPGARIVSVGMIDGAGRGGSVQQLIKQDGKPPYDFVWSTSSPCGASLAK